MSLAWLLNHIFTFALGSIVPLFLSSPDTFIVLWRMLCGLLRQLLHQPRKREKESHSSEDKRETQMQTEKQFSTLTERRKKISNLVKRVESEIGVTRNKSERQWVSLKIDARGEREREIEMWAITWAGRGNFQCSSETDKRVREVKGARVKLALIRHAKWCAFEKRVEKIKGEARMQVRMARMLYYHYHCDGWGSAAVREKKRDRLPFGK